MKSVQLFLYKPETHTLESRANEWDARWMTALTALDEECYLGAENSYNLFVVRKNSDAATDEERNNLTVGVVLWWFTHIRCTHTGCT